MNDAVRDYWEAEPCGTGPEVAGERGSDNRRWFAEIEGRRYALEPFVRTFAQFGKHRGQSVLEIGVGAGTDHLQWARAGARCHGVDITQAAVDLTRDHLALHGYESDLHVADAEHLPYEDDLFDIVYSWGVIHHAADPQRIVNEVDRVLRPGGQFIGMLYGRHSVVALKLWLRHGLLRARPWTTLSAVISEHMESPGTKAYTEAEVLAMFRTFRTVELERFATPYDRRRLPSWLGRAIPPRCGWFIAVRATKGSRAQ